MMTVWNVSLGQRQLLVEVRKVLQKEPEFMVIVDSQGKQHRLSQLDFPSFEWQKIGVGSTITLTVSESVTRWRVRSPSVSVEESVKKLVVEAKNKIFGLFFIWICQHCEIKGYVGYEEGDDLQRIAERIVLAHKKEVKAGCATDIRIFDHRGMEQKDSALLLSSHRVA